MKFPIYLDHHSTTPVDPKVFDAMKPYFLEKFGNASSKNHSYGWEAESAVENSRKIIADFINAESNELYFTSGATESINLAHFGIAQSYYSKGKHIITSAVEHSAVLDSLKILELKGFEVTNLPVNSNGFINPEDLKKLIRKDTILVSVMSANNEIGSINNLEIIGQICKEIDVFFHTDANQAIGRIDFDVEKFHIDLASFSAHKIYGPKGIGAIYIRKNPKIKITPQIFGGGHENNIRSGTLNVPSIVGFGKAVEILANIGEEENKKLKTLRDHLLNEITLSIDEVFLNGSLENRLANNLNLSFKYIKAETLIMELRDIAVSTAAACASATLKPSHVLKAIGLSDELAKSSIRFGLGRFNNIEEINYVISRFKEAVNKLREESPILKLKSEQTYN